MVYIFRVRYFSKTQLAVMKTKVTIFIFVFAIFMSTHIRGHAQVNVQDSLALVDLYNSTNGPGWLNHKNWLTSMPVSKWYGVTVTDTIVTKIKLEFNGLVGTLPSSFGNLVNLSELYLDNN